MRELGTAELQAGRAEGLDRLEAATELFDDPRDGGAPARHPRSAHRRVGFIVPGLALILALAALFLAASPPDWVVGAGAGSGAAAAVVLHAAASLAPASW